jgi:hypothetical protein
VVTSLGFRSADGAIIFANNGIYKDTDGGVTSSFTGAGATLYVRAMAINPAQTTTIYAATDNGVYKSTDGAVTWNTTGLMTTHVLSSSGRRAISQTPPPRKVRRRQQPTRSRS